MTIPKSVTKIGVLAFYANDLTEIVIPDSVVKIDEGAFQANRLTQVTIPKNVKVIGPWAFSNNPLNMIEFDEGSILESIGEYAFYDHAASKVHLPGSVIYTGEYAFFPKNTNSGFTLTLPKAIKEGEKFLKWSGEKNGSSLKKEVNAGGTVSGDESFEYSYKAVFNVKSNPLQKGIVSGTLRGSDKKPLTGYKVTLHSEPMTTVTDKAGKFVFTNVEYSQHALIVETPEGVEMGNFTLDFQTADSPGHHIDGHSLVIYYTNRTSKSDFSLIANKDSNYITVENVAVNEKTNAILYIILAAGIVLAALVMLKIRKIKN